MTDFEPEPTRKRELPASPDPPMDPQQRSRLRAALHAFEDTQSPAAQPVEPGKLWDALHAKLPNTDALTTLADHLASAHGHQELAVLAAMREEFGSTEVAGATDDRSAANDRPATTRVWVWGAIALAAAVLVALLVWPSTPPTPEAHIEYREPATASVASTVPTDAKLDRNTLELTWSKPEEDCVYAVRVSTATPTLITQATGLTEPRFAIPVQSLGGVPAGTELLWQVDFQCANGLRGRSRTFVNTVQ